MGQTLEIVINYYQSRPESVFLALVILVINLICQLLLLCRLGKHLLDFMLVSFML